MDSKISQGLRRIQWKWYKVVLRLPWCVRRAICSVIKHEWVHCYEGSGCARCGAYYQNLDNPQQIVWKTREEFVEWWKKNKKV